VTEEREIDQPHIRLVETPGGETTLWIDDAQAMQGWERELMWDSADLLCTYGTEFLEAGLGLGLSALRIASNRRTRKHVVVEKYAPVIELFRERTPDVPPTLEIVNADFFDYVRQMPAASVDGIFFDPYLVSVATWKDVDFWNEMVPLIRQTLRPGGAFIPCFSTEPVLRWPFFYFFERVVVERRSYTTYAATQYMLERSSDAYIECFIK